MQESFDIYQCIRNIEIREFFRQNNRFTVNEKIQLILHSYASIEKKREMFQGLSESICVKDEYKVRQMITLFNLCIMQIYNPKDRVLYVRECISNATTEMKVSSLDVFRFPTADIEFYDSMEKLLDETGKLYNHSNDLQEKVYVYQIILPQNQPHQILMEFEMLWMEEKLQIVRVYPNEPWLIERGVLPETLASLNYYYELCHLELPFENGCRLKIQTPIMQEPIYGILQSEKDSNGCWYHFFKPDGMTENEHLIDLSYHEIQFTSGYSVFDWVERCDR